MRIRSVQTPAEAGEFLRVPQRLHRNNPDWICTPDAEVSSIFDPAQNLYFKHGKAERWLLLNEAGTAIGRVAAFVNEKTAYGFEQATGGMGFFDCPDNQAMADLLFQTAQDWLAEQGMDAMDGPINFGENFNWWGLQIEGRRMPLFGNNFTPAYYQRLFENFGFEIYYRQYFYEADLRKASVPARMRPMFERLTRDGHYSARKADLSDIKRAVGDFCRVYNEAWTVHNNAAQLEPERIEAVFRKLRPIIDPDLLWFAWHDERPIGMWLMLPDANQILRKIQKGKLNLLDKIRFWWYRRNGVCRRVYGLVFGIVPEYHNRGVDALLIAACAEHLFASRRYDFLELAWIGDYNPRMMRLMESLGVEKIKTYATLRKIFDPGKKSGKAALVGAGAEKVAARLRG